MAVNYTDVQKTEKYISRTNFDALEMAAVPEGTELNIIDQIHESDLDSDVLQKLNNNAKINTANTFTAAQTFKKDITIEGNIIQNGSAYETHAEKLYTKNDMIFTRDGATAALADNAYTGIQAVKYDGTNDGQLVFGKDGVARVGDVGNTQPLATRAETGNIVDKHLLQWDAAGQTLVDSNRTVDEFAMLGSDNNFTGENRFAQEVQVQSDTAGVSVVSSEGNAFAGLLKDRCRVWDASNPTNIISSILRTESLQFRAGSTTTRYYLNKITYNKKDLLFPETEAGGTFALTENLPVANPTAEGTVTLTKLKVGDVVYTIPSGGGSGDVTAAGNNIFTGNNTFTNGIKVAVDSTATSAHIVYGSDGIKVKKEGTPAASPEFSIKIPTDIPGTFAVINAASNTLNTPGLNVSSSATIENMLLGGLTFKPTVTYFSVGSFKITLPTKTSTLATTDDISSFVKNNASTNFSVYDEVSGNKSTLGYSGLTLEDPVAHNTCMLSPAGLVHKQMSNDETITLHNTTLAFGNNGLTTTLTVPNKTGTLAIMEDIPIASATLSDNDTTLTLILR